MILAEHFDIFLYFFKAPTAKVLVATGTSQLSQELRQNTEVLDLKNENATCPKLAPFPLSVADATGSLLKNQPIICGGRNYGSNTDFPIFPNYDYVVRDECWHLKNSSNSWSLLSRMTTRRIYHTSVPVNDTYLWVLGGVDDGYGNIRSTEYVDLNGNTQPGPELPLPISRHVAYVQVTQCKQTAVIY